MSRWTIGTPRPTAPAPAGARGCKPPRATHLLHGVVGRRIWRALRLPETALLEDGMELSVLEFSFVGHYGWSRQGLRGCDSWMRATKSWILFIHLSYICTYPSIIGCTWFGNDHNGIDIGMKNFEWHISKSCFCNGIFPKCKSCNGINPINPFLKGSSKLQRAFR
jgi:hypothetical protein